jgi:hypothetical protein
LRDVIPASLPRGTIFNKLSVTNQYRPQISAPGAFVDLSFHQVNLVKTACFIAIEYGLHAGCG